MSSRGLGNRRAMIRREAKKRKKMEKATGYKLAEYKGSQDGKLYAMCAIMLTLNRLYGWKAKRINEYIDRASDCAALTMSDDITNAMIYAYAKMVQDLLPELSLEFLKKAIPPGIRSDNRKILEYSVYASARNELYRDMCIVILDALSREPYNFGKKRLETVMNELSKEYLNIQTTSLSEYERQVKYHTGIVMED